MSASRAAIFDFDGTIANSFDELAEVYDRVALELGLRRLSLADFESFRDMSPLEAMRSADIPVRTLRAARATHIAESPEQLVDCIAQPRVSLAWNTPVVSSLST